MNIEPIAHIRTDLPQKFGIPRQSGLAADLQGTIVFEPAYAIETAVRGLEEFTHLWIIWEFENGATGGTASDIASDTGTASKSGTKQGWSPTVRPPRLGGSTRMGVFATRSPFRPNPLGLSCVRIDRIEMTHEGPVIHVLGADLRDGTPIYDIKPYIPYADCQPGATGGFTDRIEFKPELRLISALSSWNASQKISAYRSCRCWATTPAPPITTTPSASMVWPLPASTSASPLMPPLCM